jgi:hypothetical protein
VAVAGEPDGGAEDFLPAFQVALRSLELAIGCLLRRADAVLLGLEEFEGDPVRVEGLQEPAPLLERPCQDDPALVRLRLSLDDLRLQLLDESLDPGGGKLDPPVQVLDERLGVVGEDVRLAASCPGGPSLSQAVEVQVGWPATRVSDTSISPNTKADQEPGSVTVASGEKCGVSEAQVRTGVRLRQVPSGSASSTR